MIQENVAFFHDDLIYIYIHKNTLLPNNWPTNSTNIFLEPMGSAMPVRKAELFECMSVFYPQNVTPKM